MFPFSLLGAVSAPLDSAFRGEWRGRVFQLNPQRATAHMNETVPNGTAPLEAAESANTEHEVQASGCRRQSFHSLALFDVAPFVERMPFERQFTGQRYDAQLHSPAGHWYLHISGGSQLLCDAFEFTDIYVGLCQQISH